MKGYIDPVTGRKIKEILRKPIKGDVPILGEWVYIPSKFHVYRGRDDIRGGLAKIVKINYDGNLPKNHWNYIMVVFEGFSGSEYNWNSLLEKQDELRERFGEAEAFADPDDRPEYNDDTEDWH